MVPHIPTTTSATRDSAPTQPFWRVSVNSGRYYTLLVRERRRVLSTSAVLVCGLWLSASQSFRKRSTSSSGSSVSRSRANLRATASRIVIEFGLPGSIGGGVSPPWSALPLSCVWRNNQFSELIQRGYALAKLGGSKGVVGTAALRLLKNTRR